MITLRLPLPPSANVNWRHGNGHVYLSIKSKDYREQVGWLCREQGVEPVDGDVVVSIHAYMNRRRDADSVTKVLFDALNGHAWKDDGQVQAFHVFRITEFTGDPYVIVQIASKK